jgi:hypothetical protein
MKLSTMLTGATSPFIKTTIGYTLNGFGFQSITPVDLEGDNAAPAGMKPLFIRHRDDESHSNGSPDSGTNDWIELWEMTINWTANTATVAKIQDVVIGEIDSKLCGLTSFACIKQPGTTNHIGRISDRCRWCRSCRSSLGGITSRIERDHANMGELPRRNVCSGYRNK